VHDVVSCFFHTFRALSPSSGCKWEQNSSKAFIIRSAQRLFTLNDFENCLVQDVPPQAVDDLFLQGHVQRPGLSST
jgi:hypothetical protein